ncbi:kinase-like domain-containing protein [Coemansia mojavensis]|nr:kinase-like domain-containing protein [Coemansia mojavensis]
MDNEFLSTVAKVELIIRKTYKPNKRLEQERETRFYQETKDKSINYICRCLAIDKNSIILEYASNGRILDYLKEKDEDYIYKTKLDSKWITQLISAVYCIHELGWYHGDISTNNVLVDNRENLVLCDFTSSGKVGDKPGPKTYGFEDPCREDPQSSDVYSTGLVIWSMFNRQRPPENYRYVPRGIDEQGCILTYKADEVYHRDIVSFQMCGKFKVLISRMICEPETRFNIQTCLTNTISLNMLNNMV